MKKYLPLSALLCASMFVFTGCGDDDPVIIGIPDADTRLVSKITSQRYNDDVAFDTPSVSTFSYDSYNRIVRIAASDGGGTTIDFAYGSNQIVAVNTYTEIRNEEVGRAVFLRPSVPAEMNADRVRTRANVEYKHVYTDMYKLNSDGYVVSGTSVYQWFKDGVLALAPGEYISNTYSASYSSGRISRFTEVTKWFLEDYGKELESDSETNFTWDSGNISKADISEKDSEGNTSSQDLTLGYSSYDNPQMNVDLNQFVAVSFAAVPLDILGFFGKPCEKLVSSYTWSNGSSTNNLEWTLDEDGYPTKVVVTNTDNIGWRFEHTIQYKN